VRVALVGAALLLRAAAVLSADIDLSNAPWSAEIDAGDLQAGPGTEFNSPVVADVLVSTLAISGTGGSNWSVKVSLEGESSEWLSGMSIAVKRSGDAAESAIAGGVSYRVLTSSPETFFSGTGDYETIRILVRIDGVSAHTRPDEYNLAIRYTIESS
jgi:hypothetical protein